MARIAFVKVFTGLQLGVAQLSGELQRAGHESLIIYFKDYVVAPYTDRPRYRETKLGGFYVGARGSLISCNLYKPFSEIEYDLLVDTLGRFRPDMIGLSLCSVGLEECADVTQRLRLAFPDVPIIWGGVGPTLEPERCLEYADLICKGEGDQAILEIAERLDAGASFTGIQNVWTKRPDGTIEQTPERPLVAMNDLAFPDYEISRSVYINDDRRQWNIYPPNFGRQYHMMTQRGCPYSCSFCIESWLQEKHGKSESLRRMSVDRAIEELLVAKRKYEPVAVMFYDDVFTVGPRWLKEFAPRYKREIGLPFWCYTYPRSTRKEDIELLRDAGLASISMGIQSGSQKVLKEYNRPVANDVAVRAANVLAEVGVPALFDLMTMAEFEDEATCRETFEFLTTLPRHMKTVGFYPMKLFPDYGYTKKVEAAQQRRGLSDAEYVYWHKLYLLTRTALPPWVVRALSRSRVVRRFPKLLDPLLQDKLPFFWLDNGALDFQTSSIKLSDGSGRVSGDEELDVPHWLRAGGIPRAVEVGSGEAQA